MKGQWIGKYQGSVKGNIMVNIDEMEDRYEAVTYINPNEKGIPTSIAYLASNDKSLEQKMVAHVYPVDPRTWRQCKWGEIKHLYSEDVSHSEKANVTFRLVDGKLLIDAISDIGVTLSSILTKPSEEDESKISGETMSWSNFKACISEFSKTKYLYRGQKQPWRLRTSFHRQGRCRISEFINTDVQQLHKRLSAITSHYFDLTIPDQNGSFINLTQHHGYPTPLLDWTYSPYVAAFFAFRGWPKGYSGKNNIRIYMFDYDAWKKKYSQIQTLDPPFPHLSVVEFIALDNPRFVPQQSVTTATNIDDIEAHVLKREAASKNQYLKAIDISADERDVAMRDLRVMGITAGSMFPSIDGVCEELRECNFNK